MTFVGNNPKTTANDASYGPEYPPCFLYAYKCDGGVDCPDDDPNEDQVCPEESASINYNVINTQLLAVYEIISYIPLIFYSQILDG